MKHHLTLGPAAPHAPHAHLASWIGQLGREGFVPHLLQVCRDIVGATDCSLFIAQAGGAPRLLGAASLAGHGAEDAGQRYLRGGYFRLDSNHALAFGVRDVTLNHQRKDDLLDAGYRSECYDRPGLQEKLSLLVPMPPAAGQARCLFVNAYRSDSCRLPVGQAFDALGVHGPWIAAMALRHAELLAPQPAVPPDPLALLTGREREVVQAVLDGLTAKEIARRLAISPTSVATYRQRAFQRLGVRRQAELFRLVREAAAAG